MHKEKSVPEIRFKSFDKDWNVKELKDLSNRVTRKNSNNQTNLPLTISAQDGLIDQRKYFSKQVASKNMNGYYLIKNGEFAYNKSYSKDFPLGAIKRLNKYSKGALSTLYIVFAIKELDIDFFESYLDSGHWHKEVYKRAAEGARNHGLLNIPVKDFFEINIYYPNDYKEQQKIGDLFEKLDQVISLQQQVLEATKDYKQSMLQKMFPKKGEKVPEIRFKEFEGKWENKKLGDLLSYEQPTKYLVESSEYDDSYKTPVLTAGKSFLLGYTNEKTGIYNKGDIILFDDFTTAFKYVNFDFKVKSSATKFLTAKENNNLRFLYEAMKSIHYPVDSHKRYWISEYTTLKIYIPSLEEQQKIGSFFKTLDEKIEQEEKKLEAYESMKKALMQRMFV